VVVSVESVRFRYGERTALDGISFGVREREVFGILGPNGGGKSTLFRILATMLAPSGGTAVVAGFDVARRPSEVRRSIGVVFQSQSLDRKLTVTENLRAQGHLYGMHGGRLDARIAEALDRLGLVERRNDLVRELSGGLRQRVEVAKAVLHSPAVLLMDEPSTGLDPGARRELWRYIGELRDRDRITVLLTTHILEEADRCDRLALLHQGRVVAQGTPAELKARIGGDVVVLESADPDSMRNEIERRFGVRAVARNGSVRVEIENGHRFIADAFEALPGAIASVALHRPTLEDVFLDETGATLE
jgi:ABC-2 type transport system ATP-binding protein